jgi:LSD1 subclass zinc finger protein
MLESLVCNSCGAPLEVPNSARFIKCNHCNTTLRIHRSEGSTSTEAIEKLAKTTEQLADQVERLTLQNQLEMLDRKWESERRSFMVRGKNGSRQMPAKGLAWASGAAAVLFGGLWTIMAIAITSSAPNEGPFRIAKFVFPLFGVAFILAGLFGSAMIFHRANQFESAQKEYYRRREDILRGEVK